VAKAAILVNGLPASGKTTLAGRLGLLLGCPVLSKDPVKELFADLTSPTVAGDALGGIAMDALWALAAQIPDGVIVDSFWLGGRDEEHARSGIERSGAGRVVEVWCDLPPAEARERFDARADQRHSIHSDRLDQFADAQPLAIWPVVRVDTRLPVDFETLLPELAQHLLA
jgi:predicted kinase